jgi:hypothetical protein
MVWPLSSRCVALPGRRPAWRSQWECRNLRQPAGLVIPAASTALRTAFWTGGDPVGEGPPAGIGHHASGGLAGTPVARPIPCRHSGLSSPGPGAVAPCPSLPPERAMELSHLPQLVLERFQQAVRQQRVPVLVAFAGTHGQNRWASLPLPGLRHPAQVSHVAAQHLPVQELQGGREPDVGSRHSLRHPWPDR